MNKLLFLIFTTLASFQNWLLSHGKFYITFAGEKCEVVKYTVLRNENDPQYGRILRSGNDTITVYF